MRYTRLQPDSPIKKCAKYLPTLVPIGYCELDVESMEENNASEPRSKTVSSVYLQETQNHEFEYLVGR